MPRMTRNGAANGGIALLFQSTRLVSNHTLQRQRSPPAIALRLQFAPPPGPAVELGSRPLTDRIIIYETTSPTSTAVAHNDRYSVFESQTHSVLTKVRDCRNSPACQPKTCISPMIVSLRIFSGAMKRRRPFWRR